MIWSDPLDIKLLLPTSIFRDPRVGEIENMPYKTTKPRWCRRIFIFCKKREWGIFFCLFLLVAAKITAIVLTVWFTLTVKL